MAGHYSGRTADCETVSQSREGIDSYTAIADRLFIRRSNVLFSNGDGEIFEAMFQAAQGEISVDEFLRQADKKTQMMILEGK